MSLSSSTLAKELEAMIPVSTEAEGIAHFVDAFANYFVESSVAGVPISSTVLLEPAKNAMAGAMVGVLSNGSAAISAGITAFWSVVVGSAATLWVVVPPLASGTPPPLLGTLAPLLTVVGEKNMSDELEIADAVKNIADVIHSTQLGGLVLNTAVPPVSLPIL